MKETFKKLFTISMSRDYSKLYENLAFLHLRRSSDEVYYFKQTQEVDLYVKTDKEYLVNVAYQIEDAKTFQREIGALTEGMRYFNLTKSYLVTAEKEETLEVDEGYIEVIPMWKWLLVERNDEQ